MARWYASVNDDVRHHLVEQAWYGQNLRQDVMSQDVERSIDYSYSKDQPQRQETPQQFAEVYGRDPHMPEHGQGRGAYGVENPDGDVAPDVTHTDYGYDQANEARHMRAEELYGQDYAQSGSRDLYGHEENSASVQADLYGYQPPDIEQER